ncbi:putative disease resistance protein RGA3 [Cinnamomum micranthum f. kanehirae]|uniref:Putative disease resistance protein RGA3 n=1 Tax=Cinnamomum micranthum f. kanehirae TaxID=337451 RepID=A0A3S3MU80_9MAGN|nr:putative disease resistance protein RGA3 [Cinnamomum micranthum f. kanehirae]
MHDLVHDLATFVSSGEYSNMEAGSSKLCPIKCHHLSFLNYYVSSIPSLLCKVERLHTLLLFGHSNIMADPDTLFNPLRYLRALDLSGTCIENLPSFIGKLKHLRYLNLRGLTIVELPESVTDLCNLQTLKLNYCKGLRRLPSGISKMVKLRHLEIENTPSLKVLPHGLGRLTSLRTLSKFPVGDENGGCKIGELKDLCSVGEPAPTSGARGLGDSTSYDVSGSVTEPAPLELRGLGESTSPNASGSVVEPAPSRASRPR